MKIISLRNYYPLLTVIAALLAVNVILTAAKPRPTAEPATGCDLCREYQLEVSEDEVIMYDGARYVTSFHYNGTCQLDKAIREDNR